MSPIDFDVIEQKKAVILQELKVLKRLEDERISASSDIFLKHVLCRSIQNATSATIDIAQHIVSQHASSSVPTSYSEAIERLGVIGSLDSKFAHDLAAIARLRNVVVHLYEKLDFDRLALAIPVLRKQLNLFLKNLKIER